MVQAEKGSAPSAEDEFLMNTAAKVLGGSFVATTTVQRLTRDGIDAKRLVSVLLERHRETHVGVFKLKLVDADPETPGNFGVLVRREQAADGSGKHQAALWTD